MKTFIVLLLVGLTLVAAAPNLDDFRVYLQKYDKHYEPRELLQRYAIWRANYIKIDKLNKIGSSAIYGENQFTDMTPEEFSKFPCGGPLSRFPIDNLPSAVFDLSRVNLTAPGDIPTNWDWTTQGAVVGVKNQGSCGSCWAFSAVGNLEGSWFLSGHPLTSLSESQFVDCAHQSFGCGGGWPFWAFQDGLQYQGGVEDSEASYPYVPMNQPCKFSPANEGAAYTSYTVFCSPQKGNKCSETDMANWLYTLGPLSVCLDANSMQYYTGGVDDPTYCNPNYIDHCVTLVGYGVDATSGKQFWKIKNSWGTSWGEQGYYRLVRGKGACGINSAVTAVKI
jgi:hypothetical protein